MSRAKKKPAVAEGEVAEGMVRLKAPKRATSVSFDGEEYAVEGGYVVVPEAAYAELVSHGYSVDEDEAEADETEE